MAAARKTSKQTGQARNTAPAGQASRLRKGVRVAAKTLAPVLVLALGIASFAGLKATKPEVTRRALQERVWPVKAVAAEIADFQPALTLYGRTVAGRRVELRSLVSGEVLETGPHLREGGVVARGDVLLRIDPFQYRGALAEADARLAEARAKLREIGATIESELDALKRAREQLEISRRDLQRVLPLAEKGAVSMKVADDRRMSVSEREQSLDQRVNNLAIQRARAAQQRAVISQLEWRVRQAKRNLEDTVLTAPFDAYVTHVGAETGRIVSANDPVATLLDANWLEVRFTLSDRQYGRIAASGQTLAGRRVKVLWHVGDEPVIYGARIERIGAEIAAEKGGVEIYARLDNPNSPMPIRAGAFVEIRMPDRIYENVTRLPHAALYGSGRLYIIENGRLRVRRVELVGAAGEQVLVRGGIRQGDRVMTTRLSAAEDGLRVEER